MTWKVYVLKERKSKKGEIIIQTKQVYNKRIERFVQRNHETRRKLSDEILETDYLYGRPGKVLVKNSQINK